MSQKRDEKKGHRHCMLVHARYPIGETRVEREAQALVSSGYEVDVICLRSQNEVAQATVDGVQIYRMPVKRHRRSGAMSQLVEYLAFFAWASVYLIKLHWQRRYDVIQVHNLPDFLVFAALIPKLVGARVILDLHDLMPEFYAERFEQPFNGWLVRLVRWQEWVSCRFADQIITVTELWRQTLIERGQPADKVAVVMNVADAHVFNRDAGLDMSERYGSTWDEKAESRFRLIYHGALAHRHGLDLAVRAVNSVRQTTPDIQLIIHGDGRYRRYLTGLANELDLLDHVHFSPHLVPTAELPNLLKRAHLAVVPYRNGVFTGGILPTKMMEYAALGIPIIASRTPAINAYFDDTMIESFAPEDADELAQCILRLHRNWPRLAELVQGMERFNERYSWAVQSANYVALVDRLIRR